MLSRLLQRLASPFRVFGWAAGGLYLLDQGMRRISPRFGLRVYEFMMQPIGGTLPLTANLSKNLSVRSIVEGDPEVGAMPARDDIKAQRFSGGAQCLGVYRKGELLGYLWYSKGRHQEDEVRCDYELSENAISVVDFDLYVLPKYRMGIGFLGVWHGANVTLAAQGIQYTFSRMTRFNLPSRRAHARLGSRCIGRAVFLQAWCVEFMFGTLAPFFGATFTARQRLTLRLQPRPRTLPPQ